MKAWKLRIIILVCNYRSRTISFIRSSLLSPASLNDHRNAYVVCRIILV